MIQRVKRASVTVNGESTRSIGKGLMILLGVQDTDDLNICEKLAKKCAELRIFEDEQGKLNLSAQELGLSALVVSNFTLLRRHKKGPPSQLCARGEAPAGPTAAYERFVEELRKTGLHDVQTGEFGADMQIDLVNDGPVTIVIETDDWK